MSELTKTSDSSQKPASPAPLKLVPPGDLFNRVEKLYESIANRAFELFEHNGRNFGHDLDDWFKAESQLLHPVHVGVEEADGKLIVSAEVPGFTSKDLDISLEGRQLTITGKRETKEERKEKKNVYTEHCSNEIMRVIYLPADVDVTKASATLDNGILRLEVPKASEAKKIAIQSKVA